MRRYIGEWWLPQKPDQPCKGELELEPFEDAKLTLYGRLPGLGFGSSGEVVPLLQGQSRSGELLTVCDCPVGQTWPTADSNIKVPLYPGYVFIGAHFTRPDRIQFSSTIAKFEQLADWTDGQVIDRNSNDDMTEIQVTYRKPDPLEVGLEGLKIRLESSWSMSGVGGPSLTLQHEPYVRFKPDEARDFRDYLHGAFVPFRLFLAFGLGSGVGIERVIGFLPDELDVPAATDSARVEVFYHARSSVGEDEAGPEPIFFRMNELGEQEEVARCLRRWYEKAKWLGPVASQYAAGFYRSMYDDNDFLNLTQALESYHRKCPRYDGKYLPQGQYQNLVFKPLLDALPDDDDVPDKLRESMSALRDSFKGGTLKHGNEYSLRKRLTELVEDVPDLVHRALNPNPGGFVEQVVDTRNYLVHLDEDAKEDAASGTELQYLANGLRALLKALLFKEMDLSEDKQRNIFERSIRFQELSNM